MAISVKHAFQSAKADGPDSTLVQPSSWNAEHTITAAAGKVLGRDTSGAGAIQELPIAVDVSGNVALGGALSVDGNTTLGNASTDSVTVNAASFSFANATTIAGTITYSGAVSFNGNTTLGDASTDTVTLNAGTVSIPNNVNFSGGNLGIGTSSPTSKLDVSGNLTLSGIGKNTTDSRIIRAPASTDPVDANRASITLGTIAGASSSDSYIDFATNKYGVSSGTRMRIDSAGNVGIGTTSPNITLFVQGAADLTYAPNPFNMRMRGTASATSGNSGSGIAFQGYTTGTSTASDLAFISGIKENTTDANYAGALVFGTRPNGSGGGSMERMRIDSAGNVGIGAASLGSLLEIRKDQNADTIAKVINSNTGVNATARLDLATGTANAYCIFALKDNGGSPHILMSSGSAITAMYHDMASHIFRSQAGTEWLRIEATAGTLLSAPTYNNTATGSTVVVTSTGQIRRTSSSIKYKKDVESLDPALATNAIDNLRPVWYRTKNAEGDDKVTWSHIGLIAEEVDLVEPRLVRYRTAEIVEEQKPVLDEAGAPVLNDEGNPTFTTEQVARELAVPEPEDVDYARLSVLLLAELQSLRARVAALEAVA